MSGVMNLSQTRIQYTPYPTSEYMDASFFSVTEPNRFTLWGSTDFMWLPVLVVMVAVAMRMPMSHLRRHILIDRSTDSYSFQKLLDSYLLECSIVQQNTGQNPR